MQTNADLTLYNKYTAGGVTYYVRHQVTEVVWEDSKGSNVLKTGGTTSANQAVIYIPRSSGLIYMKPKAWLALVDKTTNWTLQKGDVVVRGLVTDDIGPAFTITALKNKYDDVLEITSVDSMDQGSLKLQHWQLGVN